MPSRDIAVRDQPGAAQPSRALQARARADIARKTAGNALPAPGESAALVRQRARAQRAQGNGKLARVSKVYGTDVPADMAAAEVASGMDSSTPFSPGAPLSPYDGYGRTPRSQNFVPQTNVTTRPRTHERVSFQTLKGLIDAYDIASMAIWHRIDSLRSLEWSLVAADGHEGDITSALVTGMAVLAKPDGQTPFGAWIAEYAYDILAYDAGTLWRMRNRLGQAVGLRVVDGSLIAPLLDDWGNTPEAPAPAYVQYINGLPWNWLTTNDLIYRPFRKRPDSPYGRPPLESVLLNANTDLRFQAYFLQRFTEGNLPAAFASAPESWTPQQIESFQEYWDGFILGDQTFKSQIRWIPPGSKIEWSNEKDFTDEFSLFMMRKTLAAYHVVPSDMGITDTVNKSTGETQADVQHRIGDVPLAKHISDILTAFLQDDLRLPLKFQFDFGEEQDDRLQLAQADQIYIQNAVVSPSEIRELRFGLGEPDGRPVPRYIFSTRSGAVPLDAVFAVAGEIDPESAAPLPGAPLPHKPFAPIAGVEPNPVPPTKPLAVQIYGDLTPPAPNPQVGDAPAPHSPMPTVDEDAHQGAPVTKDGEGGGGAPTSGITAATGVYSYDGPGHVNDEGEPEDEQESLAKAELGTYRRYLKQRRRAGRWKDFEFEHVDALSAHRLNDAGRLEVRKASGAIAVAGLAVMAEDTGRVLMLQRGLDPDDPASGLWEFPGGHVEDGETAGGAAEREWQEETGCLLPADAWADADPEASWTSTNGIYRGIVVTIPREDCIEIAERGQVGNPDDPDGDLFEAIAWWDPALLRGNPALRPELRSDADKVLAAIKVAAAAAGVTAIAKAADGGGQVPKADASAREASAAWPGWNHDLDAADHWAGKLTDGYIAALSRAHAEKIAASFKAAHPQPKPDKKPTKAETAAIAAALVAAALAHLESQGFDLAGPAAAALAGLYTDGYLIGAASGNALLDGGKPALGTWTPGDTAQAQHLIEQLALGAGLSALLLRAPQVAAGMAGTLMAALAAALAAGVAAGESAVAIAESMIEALGAAWRSLTAAITEITTGSSAGATDTYEQQGVKLVRWALDPSSNSCPACIGNANAKPRPIGQTWPSGDTSAPIHARCRCSVVPA